MEAASQEADSLGFLSFVEDIVVDAVDLSFVVAVVAEDLAVNAARCCET